MRCLHSRLAKVTMNARMNESKAPFTTLGQHLKYVREQSRQSLAEVSGAVEIDEQTLRRIEAGQERPAEDVLLLLISHFGMPGQEAAQLWDLAEYDSDLPEQINMEGDLGHGDLPPGGKVIMVMALDMRTIYSDGLDIHAAQTGLTLNFTQTVGPNQLLPVARVGMSYEQAQRVLIDLQRTLLRAKYLRGPLALPPTSQSQSASDDVTRS